MAEHYVLEKVVEVSRHGVRPPTPHNTETMEAGTARKWPVWLTHDGELTGHGYAASIIKGHYEADGWRKRGLLPRGCPNARDFFVWASPYQRTKATAKALTDGAFPGCSVHINNVKEKKDPLFHNDKMGLVRLDKKKALNGIYKTMGGRVQLAQRKAQKHIEQMKSVVCLKGHPCPLFDHPWKIKQKSDGRFEVEGLTALANMAETFRLSWSNNNPVDQIAFGHVHSAKDIAALMPLLTTKYDYMKDVPYIAARGGSTLMNQIANALEYKNKEEKGSLRAHWILYVAHDGNVAWLRTMLHFTWKLGLYPRGNIPPTGSLIFERWLDKESGERFIRLYFQAQSLNQIRYLTKLDQRHPPLKQEFFFTGCQVTTVGVLCPYSLMLKRIENSIDESAVVDVSY